MNSINEIAKYKYESNNNSPVNLDEYIVIEDKALNEKYLLFKLHNSISEELKKVECQVIIYNENNFIVEDIKFSFTGNFQGDSYFVPDQKLKINSPISSIKFNVIYLEFETLKFVDGSLVKIPQTIDDFMKKSGVDPVVVKKPNKWNKKLDKLKYKSTKKNVKKDNKRQYVTNVNKSNRTKIHIVLTSIFGVIVLAYFIASMIIYQITAKVLSDKYCDYVTVNNAEITLVGNYNTNLTNYSVPEAIGNQKVTKIGSGAFRGNTKIQSITLNYYVEIGSGAFEGCSNLTTIINPHFITKISPKAFLGTKINTVNFVNNGGELGAEAFPVNNINIVNMPNTVLTNNSLKNFKSLSVLEFARFKDNAITLRDVLGGDSVSSLNKIITYNDFINENALNGYNINTFTLYGINTSFRSNLLTSGMINYFRIKGDSKTLFERTNNKAFKTLHVELGTNTNVNFFQNVTANMVVLDKGSLQTNHLINLKNAISVYISNDVNYSYVDFERILKNNNISNIYFEGDVPRSIMYYYSNVKGNVARSTYRIEN